MRRLMLVLLVTGLAVGSASAQTADSLRRAAVSLEGQGRWRDAIPVLEQYLRLVPDDAERTRQLGQYLAWAGDRERGVAMLRRALEHGPSDPATMAALGEVLSWDPAARQEAASLFEQALRLDPGNLTAREGQANLMTWRGEAARALPLYDSILARSPNAVGALRGKGGALNQLRRFDEAEVVLRSGLALAPEDPGLRQEMAQLSLGQERFGEARRYLRGLDGPEPHLRLLRDSTVRGLGSSAEAGGILSDRSEQLDALRGEGRVSVGLGPAWRVHASYQYSDFSDSAGHFSGSAWGVGLAFRPSRIFGFDVEGGSSRTDGPGEPLWGGSAVLKWQPSEVVRLTLSGSRLPVEETRRSTRGVTDPDGLRGVVEASLATAGVDLSLLGRRVELGGRAGYGANTGEGLERNERLVGELTAGWVVRSYRPYFRVGYAHQSAGYDYNASEYAGRDPVRIGGYFSPYRYFLNYGTVTVSHRFGGSVFWEFDGRVGGQVTREYQGELSDARVAGAVNTHLTWRMGARTDLDVRYQYSNTFNAFRLNEVRVLLRQYF